MKLRAMVIILVLVSSGLVWVQAEPGSGANAGTASRNILWDGEFELGYGNHCWGTTAGNLGPNRRANWTPGVLALYQAVASRIYWLEDGSYALSAWVRRGDTNAAASAKLTVILTNQNDAETKRGNAYRQIFQVPVSNGWQRVGWTLNITDPLNHNFHVELKAEGDGLVLVDAVALTRGVELPVKVRPAADVEAGFNVSEETGIYVDGEARDVELVIRNHGEACAAKVLWEIYDYRETLVRKGSVEEILPACSTVRRPLPVTDLPWNGYRFACSVEGQAVVGDALVAFLPRIPQDAFMQYGGDAPVNPWAADFTATFMRKLGMQMATTLSPGGVVGRWGIVESRPGSYVWQDQSVDKVRNAGVDVVGFLGMKHVPDWLPEAAKPGSGKSVAIEDEATFTNYFCRYVDAFVRHYAGRVTVIHLEDEIHTSFDTPAGVQQLVRLYGAASAAAKKAARESGSTVAVGFNGTQPAWWGRVIDAVGATNLEFVSQNTNLRPGWTAETLNIMRSKGCFPPYFYTIGVGQKSLLRKVSLPQDRTTSAGNPPGLFAWQMMMGMWLSRPYGTEDLKDGPLIRYGYYDLRTLGQCLYFPNAGKTCVEYDNSPTLGIQAMAMLKWFLAGQRAARNPAEPFSLHGFSLASTNTALQAYPFRNGERATVVLTTYDGTGLDNIWHLTSPALVALKPVNHYNQPLAVTGDTAIASGLPVFLSGCSADQLAEVLAACTGLVARIVPASAQQRVEVGRYVLDINPDRPGVIQLSHVRDGKETILIDRIVCTPALPRPTIDVVRGRLDATVTLVFPDGNQGSAHRLGITLGESGVMMQWSKRNGRTGVARETVRFRVNPAGAGREIVIQEGAQVRAGILREDYGQLFLASLMPPARLLDANAAWVSIRDFATFDLPSASGRGFTPASGLRWKVTDGEAWLEASYEIGAYKGGGSRGVQSIELLMTVTVPQEGKEGHADAQVNR